MKIILEGVAGKRFGREHTLHVHSPQDAIRALCHRLPGFRAFLEGSHEYGIFWQILTNNQESGISYEELGLGCQEMVLVPVITGARPWWQNVLTILLGIALVAFAITGFGFVTFGAAGTISAGIQSAIAGLGFGLIFTGVAGLLSPGTPQRDNGQEGKQSDDAVFDGASPTAAQGTPVPLLYGTFLAQSMPIISSYIDNNKGYYLGIISEGQIEGLAGPASDNIFLNGARLGNLSVDNIELTDGEQTGTPISFVKSGGFHLSAGTTLQAITEGGDPNQQVVRSFAQSYADNLQIRLAYGPCYMIQSHSGETSAWTRYKPYTDRGKNNPLQYNVRVVNGNNDVIYDTTFTRGASGPVKALKLQIIDIDISEQPIPISITVTRLDRGAIPDPETVRDGETTTDSYQWAKGDVTFVSADVTWAEQLRYPKTALLGIKFNVAEFTQMPSVHAKVRGIKVPTVSSSLRVSYAYSDNPAYVLLDLLTNARYGVGGRSYTKSIAGGGTVVQPGIRMQDLDLASFRNAAQYCQDNNITFNGYIDGVTDAYDLLKSVASCFQAQIYYAGGKISLAIDKPVTADSEYRLFSEANVIQEAEDNGDVTTPCFIYEGVAKAARRTIANVSYIDPTDYYKEKKVSVHHPEAIERYGYRPVDVRALGCTSEAQAARLGRYIIGSDIYNNETVTFKVGTEGALLLPGDVVIIADGNKTPGTYGGRISSAGPRSITIDRDLPSGSYNGRSLYVYGASGVVQKSRVDSYTSRVITVSSNFSSVPSTLHMWIMVDESDSNAFRRYRIQKVSEQGNGTYEVIGIKYDERKFDFVNSGSGTLSSRGTNLFSPAGTPSLLPSGITFGVRVNP
jgi:predicted phage tail protein